MYSVKKRIEISASHHLVLDYESKCQNVHGHNWIITVYCHSEKLNDNGMVVDFTHIKSKIHDVLDHKDLNSVLGFNPTAENIARWVCSQVDNCYKVTVQESEGNEATYELLG